MKAFIDGACIAIVRDDFDPHDSDDCVFIEPVHNHHCEGFSGGCSCMVNIVGELNAILRRRKE